MDNMNVEFVLLGPDWTPEMKIENWFWTSLPPMQQIRAKNNEFTIFIATGMGGYTPYRKLGHQPLDGVTLWINRSSEMMATRAVSNAPMYLRLRGRVMRARVYLKGYSMVSGMLMFEMDFPSKDTLWLSTVTEVARNMLVARGKAFSATPLIFWGKGDWIQLRGRLWAGVGRPTKSAPLTRKIGKQDPRSWKLPLFTF